MRKQLFICLIFCFTLLVACSSWSLDTKPSPSSLDTIKWCDTVEKAVEFGIKHENIHETSIFLIEEAYGVTTVFYEYSTPYGVAVGISFIKESDKGYAWFRKHTYAIPKKDKPLNIICIEDQSTSGQSIYIIFGKTSDKSAKQILVQENDKEKYLDTYDSSEGEQFFFHISNKPLSSLEFSVIKEY